MHYGEKDSTIVHTIGIMGIAIFIITMALIIGKDIRGSQIKFECENFQKTLIGDVWFECKPMGESKNE